MEKSIYPVRGVAAPRARLAGVRVIRQLHLWIGAWGAVAAILFGVTGFIQNHRAILKLPQGEATEASKLEIEVPEAARATPEALRDWLHDEQHVPIDSVRPQAGALAELNGRQVRQPARWVFSGGNARIAWTAEYMPGNATVQVRNIVQSPLAVMSRLHKGVGGGVAWILLTDSFALAMVALGFSGLLLWGRGRSPRQITFSIVGVAVVALLLVGGMAVT
ncbi:MAG: PepSY-associated TM helix domain-containing protein [Rudaea sp.]|nr:PepSY-associated TM helix domain-containing protein [Rudaea sp.]